MPGRLPGRCASGVGLDERLEFVGSRARPILDGDNRPVTARRVAVVDLAARDGDRPVAYELAAETSTIAAGDAIYKERLNRGNRRARRNETATATWQVTTTPIRLLGGRSLEQPSANE